MDLLSFRDFEIEIAPGEGGRYPVAVLRSPSGQARAIMQFPYDDQQLAQELRALEEAIIGFADGAEQLVQSFGVRLFDALICDAVRLVYDRSLQAVSDSDEGLRIKLRINAPELSTLPWEFLYDRQRSEFLALSRNTPVVRYLELPLEETDLSVRPPLRILGMVASPSDVAVLDVEQEMARLEAAIQPLRNEGKVELEWLQGQTWRDLQAAMQQGPWHVIHFVGHAIFDTQVGEGMLLLAGDDGTAAPLTSAQLGRLLTDQRTLRLVVLNACQGARGNEQSLFSSTAASLVQKGLPAVLAMQYEISDRAALEFTGSFYGALAANLPIDAAVSEARKSLSLALPGSIEWGTPVLFMRSPDGVIWDVKPRRTLPLMVLAGVGAAATAVVVLLAIILSNVIGIRQAVDQPPPQMPGDFRVAIADFGRIDPNTGQPQPSTLGQYVSEALYDNLQDVLEATASLDGGDITIWHDSNPSEMGAFRLSMIEGATDAEREASAKALAETISADMVVYGYLVDGSQGANLELEFYLAPSLAYDRSEAVGSHGLGKPLPLPLGSEEQVSDVTAAKTVLRETLEPRAEAFYWLTVGLTQQVLGRSQEALRIFQQAKEALRDWPDDDGKEILYFFTGREQLSLGQLDEAQASFEKALELNSGYARAQAALGSALRKKAEVRATTRSEDPAEALQALEEARSYLQQALALQDQALAVAAAQERPVLEAIVRTAQAKSYRLLGDTFLVLGEDSEASGFYDQALAQVDQVFRLLEGSREYRLLAQAYEVQGLTYRQQAIGLDLPADSLEHLHLAETALESCVALGQQAPLDGFLQKTVIDESCRPRYEQVIQDQQALEGAGQ